MALKITSGAWNVASGENRNQRNAKRKEMFAATGVNTASSLRNIYVPTTTRLPRTLGLFDAAGGGRIGDPNLEAIASWAKDQIMHHGLAQSSVAAADSIQSLGVISYSPDVLRAFFVTELLTSLEVSTAD